MMLRSLAVAATALFSVTAAQAQTTIYDTSSLMGTALASPDFFSTSVTNSTAFTSGVLSFDIVGSGSLDGNNGYIDIFTLAVNGTNILSGTFNMSGGGTSELFTAPSGATFQTTAYTPSTTSACTIDTANYCGGITHITVPIALLTNTTNKLTFSYDSPTSFNGSPTAGSQDISDESWRIGALSVSAVPEPETYAMLLAGLGLLGTLKRRKQSGAS